MRRYILTCLILCGCGGSGEKSEALRFPSNPCLKPSTSYTTHSSMSVDGTCKPDFDNGGDYNIGNSPGLGGIDVNSDGTIYVFDHCDSMSNYDKSTGCYQKLSGCAWSLSGTLCKVSRSRSFSLDGSEMAGVDIVDCGTACSSVYVIAGTRDK
jgi:hypothetical protein